MKEARSKNFVVKKKSRSFRKFESLRKNVIFEEFENFYFVETGIQKRLSSIRQNKIHVKK